MKYKYHHTAMRRGYWSIKSEYRTEPYSGRFGKGYVVCVPNLRSRRKSTNYYDIHYFNDKHAGAFPRQQ